MIVTYKFNTESPDDRAELEIFQQAKKLHWAVEEFRSSRKKLESMIGEKSEENGWVAAHEVMDWIMDEFYNCLNKHEVTL